jgi:hypothetical protein
MMPVAAARLRPVGRLPAVIDQPYGAIPPVACRRFAYVEPMVPDGRLEVVIPSGVGATTSESETVLVCEGFDESAIAAVKLVMLTAVGVPEISPVVAERLTPLGSPPAVMDQA